MIIDTLGYRGGAERQFAGLAIALHRRGYDINVIAYHDHQGFQKEFDQEGVYYNVISHVTNRFQKILAIKKQIDLDKPEIVISYKSGANNIACILKMLGAKWKLIVSDRNTLQEITKTTSLQYNFFYKFADAIVPNSHSQMEFIKNNFPSLINKVHVITNFTDTEEFHPQDNHIGVESKTIIVVARICKQKNVLNFIETAKLLSFKWQNKAHIYWYGNPQEGEEEYVQECYNLIKKNKLHNFFEFKEATGKATAV